MRTNFVRDNGTWEQWCAILHLSESFLYRHDQAVEDIPLELILEQEKSRQIEADMCSMQGIEPLYCLGSGDK